MRSIALAVAVVAVAGCGGNAIVRGDPVIGGRAYAAQPVPMGPLRAFLETRSSPDDLSQLEMTLGFLGDGDDKSLVVTGTLTYGGRPAELAGRMRLKDSAAGCGTEVAGAIGVEYLFNAPVYPDAWTCTILTFRTPDRQPADTLELSLNPINVGGNLVRVFPIRFAPRPEE